MAMATNANATMKLATEDRPNSLVDLSGISPEKNSKRRHSQANGDDEYNNSSRLPCDVLHLNVGGHVTAVLRRTLTSVEGSMLASRFSGRWDDSIEKDRDGNFFIDQPYELFEPMINYLRAKACETALAPPVTSPEFHSEEKRRDFVRMVEYFGISHCNGNVPWRTGVCSNLWTSAYECHVERLGHLYTRNTWT